ncbi:DUF1559 family PulG-like putative transporter [Aporhodopirellula aestuarii]|uniref:DUF1559 domain-containing protein n=1 Tax=Aporhodopirellula aestuarii TaxID=2950107 RepID=A0ABT0UDI3_9BACT|nr:DUF1559 domain-containing protein [Aporhodopirellula aestuarii]MCM2374530.1 DUF1559 domain-containing protein [Aporhodopirellula aestuarii]
MPYLFTCPHCHTRTEVEDEFSGQSGECVVCGREITLPDFAPGAASNRTSKAGGSGPRKRRSAAWVAAAVVMLLLVGASIIAVARIGGTTAQRLREGRARLASIKNMETIAQALNAYAADHGSYPAPAIYSRSGKPLLSWRVAILPYLGEEDLYERFNLSAAWDSGPNQMMTYQDMPSIYRHPDSQPWGTDTVYHLVTGSGTLFPKTGALGPKQVTDGATKTLLLVEARVSSTWTEPLDLDFVGTGGKINSTSGNDFGGVTEGGVCVVTVDGRGHFMPETTAPMTVNALVTPRGGEPLPDDVLD